MTKLNVIAEPGIPQIITTREVDAPPEVVLRAFTEPDLLAQWLGPRNLVMSIERFEPRDGGSYRYTHRDPDGNEFGFHGVFHGDPKPEGWVQTFEFDGFPGHVSMDTLTLEDIGGRTLIRTNSLFQSLADRDGMVQSGMADGMSEGYDRLEELLTGMVARV